MKGPEGREAPTSDRRTFLSGLLKGSLAIGFLSLLGAIVAYILPSERRGFNPARHRVRVACAEEIPLGKGKQVIFDGEPVWVLHLRAGFVALSAVCTHKGCIVNWDEKRLTLTCPCHAGLFDANGNVLAGPPRRPLPHLHVEVLGEEIYVGKGES